MRYGDMKRKRHEIATKRTYVAGTTRKRYRGERMAERSESDKYGKTNA